MKKAVAALLTVLLFVAGCGKTPSAENTNNQDGVKDGVTITNPVDIKIENEHPDLSGYIYLDDPNPCYKEITMKESLRFFDEKGTGIIIFSADNCPWCERAVPELNEVAKKMGVTVYFVNPYAPYNFPNSEDRSAVFATLCKKLEPILDKDENGQSQFSIPQVIAIKDGEVVAHHVSLVDGVDSDVDGPHMTDEQKEELHKIYKDMIMDVAD